MNPSIPGKILIIDDNISNLHLLVAMLSKYDYEILVARSGSEALKIASETPPDLILLDILMPDQDGFAVCTSLKSLPVTSEIPVIFLSALDDVTSKLQGFSCGGVDYISKPFYEEEVMARVRTHLSLELTKQRLHSTIHDLRAAEDARRKSEEHLQTILQSIPQQIAYFDSDLRCRYMNPGWEVLTRHPAGESVGKKIEDVFSREYYEQIQPILVQGLSGMRVQQEDIVTIDGEEKIFDLQVIPEPEEGGRILGLFVVLTDITRHKENEKAIRNLQKQMEIILSSIRSVIFVTDLEENRILYANKECISLFGDIVGRVWTPALQQELGISCPECRGEEVIISGRSACPIYSWEYENSRNGRWYLCHAIAIPWIDGRTVMMEIATDLTEKRLNELALKQLNQKMNLLSSITRHDILNKITVSKGCLVLLEDSSLDEEQSTLIEGIGRSVEEIIHFVDFSRSYEEIGIQAPVWLDTRDVFDRVISGLQKGDVAICNEIPPVSIRADPLLEKACYNLIENALRHGQNLTTITVSARESGGWLVLSIADDGGGIPDHQKELIFERGYGKNTGLGLFLVREILAISGISITECGRYPSGSRFEMLIPPGGYLFSFHPGT